MTASTIGLWVFVLVLGLSQLGLLIDSVLLITGRPSITEYCYDHPWAAVAVLLFLQSGVVGLAVHFFPWIINAR